MPLQKLQDYILESWLPTKLSTLIAGSTILLTLLAIGLPEYLQKINIRLSVEKTLLLRIVVPLVLLCLGTFTVLLLVIRHFRIVEEKFNSENKQTNKLIYRYGVYWDYKGNPYCHDCEVQLQRTNVGASNVPCDSPDYEWIEQFLCPSCRIDCIVLTDLDNSPLSLRKAREIILTNKGEA